ncbi:hypothetical protein GCM10009584_15280 [Ornithinimicrobium humiphilum]|uniref:Helix-hairpin-helix protein n=1 Tax=Ornithinimicrobium humiphilum TaxID=125288 RepID=A0A543KKS4_9MICO|nr:helix-hairpin-helix domain-containing protein [Ornithinimicrobium humiphilum]TQM95620.1 helix-hairpin-helix protein [Ornithinimicrobium humiphilum]
MIRPHELAAIRRGELDLAFRAWDRPRVRVGTRMRTAVGLVEVTEVERVALSALRAQDARRAGAASVQALREVLSGRPGRAVYRVGLRWAGPDPREQLREQIPDAAEIARIRAWLDRLDAASPHGPWTRATLALIDRSPGVRAPELAAELGRETLSWKADVRKLKEKGLTESLAIGYRLSPRGEAVVDAGGPPRERAPRPSGTALPRTIGAPATRGLLAEGITTLEQVAERTPEELRALHGVGPIAVERLGEALAERGMAFRPG